MATSIWEDFSIVPDPRVERTQLHKLEDILVITICGVICGAENWVDLAAFGRAKEGWLRTFLELPDGILNQRHTDFQSTSLRINPCKTTTYIAFFARKWAWFKNGGFGVTVDRDGASPLGEVV